MSGDISGVRELGQKLTDRWSNPEKKTLEQAILHGPIVRFQGLTTTLPFPSIHFALAAVYSPAG